MTNFGSREAMPFNDLMAQSGDGWEFFANLVSTPRAADPCQPADEVARSLARFVRTGEGRAVIEWLMDITVRQPLRITGASLEQTALLAASRQGIDGVARAVLAAIAHGETLIDRETTR